MNLLNNIGNFIQKNILDKTSVDETLGNTFNTAKTNLSSWAKPQVRNDFVNQTVTQPTLNFAQNKVIDPVKKLKNRVGLILNNASVVGGVTPNLNDPLKTPLKYNLQAWDNVRKTIPNIRIRPDLPSIGEALPKMNLNLVDSVRPLTQLLPEGGRNFANSALDKINPLMSTAGQFAKNNIISALDTGNDIIKNANKLGNGSGTDKIEGAFGLPFAITKAALLKNPTFQTLNAISSTPEWGNKPGLNAIRDFTKGATQMLGGGNEAIGNNYDARIKMNVPLLGEIKPFETVGSMYGFTKQPFFQKSSKWLSTINELKVMKSPVFNYLMTRGAKGSVEGIIQAFAEMPDGLTPQEKEKYLIDQIKFGALSEVALDKPTEVIGKGFNKVWNGVEPKVEATKKVIAKGYHDVFGKGGKWIKDLKKKNAQFPSDMQFDGKGKEWIDTAGRSGTQSHNPDKSPLKMQGGFIRPGAFLDAGEDAINGIKKWFKPEKPIANMSKNEIIDNLTKAEKNLKLYDAEILAKRQKASEGNTPFDKKFFDKMTENRKMMAQDVQTWTRKLSETMGGGKTFKDFSTKQDFDAETQRLIDNGADPFEARFRNKSEPKKIAELPKVEPKLINKVQELVNDARSEGYQDSQIATMLKNKGHDISGTDLKNQPTTIKAIFANRKKPYSETLKPSADELPPKPLLSNRTEPSAEEIAKSDRDYEQLKRGDMIPKSEPNELSQLEKYQKDIQTVFNNHKTDDVGKFNKGDDRQVARVVDKYFSELPKDTQEWLQLKSEALDFEGAIGNPNYRGMPDGFVHGSHITTLRDTIDNLRYDSYGKSPEAPLTQKSVPNTPPESKVNKFANQEARITHKDTDINTIADPELRQAIRDAKSFDDWAINEKGMTELPAKSDQKWQKVVDIENKLRNNPTGNGGKPPTEPDFTKAKQPKAEPPTDEEVKTENDSGKKVLERLINKYNMAGTQATLAVDRAGLLDIGKDQTDDIISAIEKTDGKAEGDYTPEENANIDKVKEFWNKALAIGNDMGLEIKETKDYFTHIYKQKLNSKGIGKKTLGQKTTFANERKFKTYKEALDKAGLTKAFDSVAEFGEMYMKKNLTTKAKVDFVKNMPWKTEAEVGKDSRYKSVDAIPGMNLEANQRYLPKELTEMVNSYFNSKEANKFLKITGDSTKITQDIKINAGTPFTPLNYFGITQLYKEAQTESVNNLISLFQGDKIYFHAPKNFFRSFSKNASMKFNRAYAKEIIQIKSQYNLTNEYSVANIMDGGFLQNIKDKEWGKALEKAMETATFKRLIFQNIVSSFTEGRDRLIKHGKTEKEAIKIALDAIELQYGLTKTTSKYTGGKWDRFFQNDNVSNLMKTVFFAKDYKIATAKIWINMARAVKDPLNPKNRNILAYGISLILSHGAMEAVNYVNTGHLMEQNPEDSQDKMFFKLPGMGKGNLTLQTAPGISYLPKLGVKLIKDSYTTEYKNNSNVVNPKFTKDLSGGLSIPAKMTFDLALGEDYFGNPITLPSDSGSKKMVKIGKKVLKETITPYTQGLKSAVSINKKSNDNLDENGEIKDSEVKDIFKAIEMPLGYISDNSIQSKYYFDAKKSITNKLTPEDKAIYDKIAMKETGFGAKQRDKVADAQDMANHPEVMRAVRDIALATAKKNKTEADPLYTMKEEQLKTYYQIQGLTSNPYAQKALKEKNADWYKPLSTARGAYFAELVDSGKMKKQDSDYPEKSPELKEVTDAYDKLPKGTGARSAFIKQHPELIEYWKKVNNYYNKVGEAFGIEAKPFNDFSSGSSKSGAWDKYYADKAKFALLNKLKKTKTTKLSTQLKDILNQSSTPSNSRKISDILTKNIWKNEKVTFKLPSKATLK